MNGYEDSQISPEGDKLNQPVKHDKVKIILIVIIVLLVLYAGCDVYGKIRDTLQTKYFNAGGQFIIKDLIGKSENCQKVKLQSGEEFVRTSCLKETVSEIDPFKGEILPQ